jgi:hypothetical protein
MKLELGRFGAVSSEFSRRWAQRRVNAVQRYGDILANYGSGELSGRSAAEALVRLAAEEAVRYSEDAIELGSDYIRVLLGAAGAPGRVSAAAGRGTTPRRIDIELRGPVGGQASRAFVLENKQDVVAEISFLVSDFSGPVGSAPFRAAVEFTPARLTLRPHEEKIVEVKLPLDPALFAPGLRYDAQTLVQGYNGLELSLDVIAEAPPA